MKYFWVVIFSSMWQNYANLLDRRSKHALIKTDFYISDLFWAPKNRRPKKLKQSFFVCNYIWKSFNSVRSYVQSIHYKILCMSFHEKDKPTNKNMNVTLKKQRNMCLIYFSHSLVWTSLNHLLKTRGGEQDFKKISSAKEKKIMNK